jgi:hypothetical protein
MASLTLTGERTLPGIVAENYWFRRHEAAYRLAAPHCVAAKSPALMPVRAHVVRLPCRDETVDVRPGGKLVATAPNLCAGELTELATPAFHGAVRGLRHGERLWRREARYGSLVDLQLATQRSVIRAAVREQVARVVVDDELHDDTEQALDLVFVGIRR